MKKVIIKRTFALVALCVVTVSFAGCSKSTENDVSSSVPEDSTEVSALTEAGDDSRIFGQWSSQTISDTVYTFNSDGTGNYLVMGSNMPLEYSTKEGRITIQFLSEGFADAAPLVLDYTITDNVLNIIDSYGGDTLYDKTES